MPLRCRHNLKCERHKIISLYLSGRCDRCTLELKKYKNDTKAKVAEFTSALTANDGYDGKGGQRLKEMKEVHEERTAVMEAWKEMESISRWTMANAFDWKAMIQDNEWCKDRNECFCDILMSPDATSIPVCLKI